LYFCGQLHGQDIRVGQRKHHSYASVRDNDQVLHGVGVKETSRALQTPLFILNSKYCIFVSFFIGREVSPA